jgi:hypothetical protein
MQINSGWKTKKWPGTNNPIDWKKVQCDWKYNIDLGKAIYAGGSGKAAIDFRDAGITDPTEEQMRLEMLCLYNSWSSYYKKDGKGEKNVGWDGVIYADKVNQIYKDKPWTDPNNKHLKCGR